MRTVVSEKRDGLFEEKAELSTLDNKLKAGGFLKVPRSGATGQDKASGVLDVIVTPQKPQGKSEAMGPGSSSINRRCLSFHSGMVRREQEGLVLWGLLVWGQDGSKKKVTTEPRVENPLE